MLTVVPNIGIVILGAAAISMVRATSADRTRKCVQLVVVAGSGALIYLGLTNILFHISGDAAYVSSEIYTRVVIAVLWFVLIFKAVYGEIKKEARRREKELRALNDVALAVGQSLDLDTVLNSALRSVIKIGNFDVGFIYLLNREKNILELAVAHGDIPEKLGRKLSNLRLGQEV